jgi:PAS domain S-box-containing protein
MNAIHTLSLKTAAAATRLAELESRRERGGGDGSRLVSVALRELQGALEELRVAIEHLNEMSDGMAAARTDAQQLERRYAEFLDAVPVACILSDDQGVIAFANDAAAGLLNLSARHLVGKPLLLFVADRDYFLRLAHESGDDAEPRGGDLTIRPRDRKSRRVSARVQHLAAHGQRCWFLMPKGDDQP